ncbi:hypothetical protein DENSPDRAFT_886947 [Dentipellis sp. KUC8613]|nr:hypothetical protein DENSPDRAFT_886947 [Dentipellis sp. KUC8613]
MTREYAERREHTQQLTTPPLLRPQRHVARQRTSPSRAPAPLVPRPSPRALPPPFVAPSCPRRAGSFLPRVPWAFSRCRALLFALSCPCRAVVIAPSHWFRAPFAPVAPVALSSRPLRVAISPVAPPLRPSRPSLCRAPTRTRRGLRARRRRRAIARLGWRPRAPVSPPMRRLLAPCTAVTRRRVPSHPSVPPSHPPRRRRSPTHRHLAPFPRRHPPPRPRLAPCAVAAPLAVVAPSCPSRGLRAPRTVAPVVPPPPRLAPTHCRLAPRAAFHPSLCRASRPAPSRLASSCTRTVMPS